MRKLRIHDVQKNPDGQKPLARIKTEFGRVSVLPPLPAHAQEENSKSGRKSAPPEGLIVDVTAEGRSLSSTVPPENILAYRAELVRRLIGKIYPEHNPMKFEVGKKSIVAEGEWVGSILRAEYSDNPCIRVWLDRILAAQGVFNIYGNLRLSPKHLENVLPVPAICDLLSADIGSLTRAIISNRYVSVFADPYLAMRLEFHEERNSPPTQSFILKRYSY